MTTTVPRANPKRPATLSPTPSSSIARGATARSAASPRSASSLNSAAARKPASRSSSVSIQNGEAMENLAAEAKEATERKEQLMVQLQDKDQIISNLTKDTDNLTSALHAAETRLNELYAEQGRSEQELSQRIDISEKLRTQVWELEKEKRDLLRRYNEQTSTFDAERQAFYDNEQHLKSRIQSLSQARRKPEIPTSTADAESEVEYEEEETKVDPDPESESTKQDMNDPEQEPAEMTALRLELSTLSTSYSSLQSTLVLLQGQLVDLNRVNKQLQEDNESYMILLQERTLSGQFDLLKQVGGGGDDDDDESDRGDVGSLRSTGRSTLDRVEEEIPETNGSLADELGGSFHVSQDEPDSRLGRPRVGRTRSSSVSQSSDAPRGESLADLPITGPGLDLAAELGRAENKDILEGNVDETVLTSKNKKSRKDSKGAGFVDSSSDVLALRSEVKALKDANKALSLYASKIIDRIIAQEGFEHVLAVDYDNEPATPSTAAPKTAKPRPQSVIVGRSMSVSGSESPRPNAGFNVPKLGTPNPSTKASRRSLSFDWKGFSIFNNAEKKPEPNLRPLTLKPGASSVTGARKLDTTEDENDRRERERINATMKLMGIETPTSPAPMQKAFSSPGPVAPPPSAPATNRRFSFFGTKTPVSEPASSPPSTRAPSLNGGSLGFETQGLTHEALEHAEAENSLAALDAHERSLSSEIAKGSSGGFTEIRRSSRRSRRSAGQSGGGSDSGRSTVWSAGIGEDDE
ncbi:hypothetical protein BDP27DRAFT_1266901 [Rhodocollybia butyracea]|uniref:Uncharacterized protein n=1 Tax=Rhodocollybia butyracea TaxID=206335 RepID=A0A9P5PQD6_9AGAR|nr:hypothetical protein BDP27DRAFT_1266901 [Rhodocollybia butyracea]